MCWLAVVIVFASLCFRLGRLPLLAPDEGRNAEVGREMEESGAWLVPTYNGIDYLDKPAFYFKAVAISLAALGNNATAARIPSAAFGVGLVFMAFAFCRRIHGTRCALLAAIIVATTPLFAANARTVIFDMALAFFVCGAIFTGYLAEEAEGKARRNWYLLGAASAGLATLVKGPVGFLVPALTLLVFNRLEGRKGAWKRLLAPLNLLAFFLITLPWFIGLCIAHGDFLQYGLVEESFRRFTSSNGFYHAEPVYFYVLIVAATFFPWSLLLPEASLAAWKERWAKNRADRLCIVWSVAVVAFFSLSRSKLPGYILSVAVASGILVARLFEAALANPEGKSARLVRRATAVFAVACLVAGVVGFVAASQMYLVSKPLRIPPADASLLRHEIAPLVILLFLFGLAAIAASYRRSALLCFLSLALFLPSFGVAGLGAFDVIFEAKSGRRLADQLTSLPPGTELACFQCFPNGLLFYLGRTATVITGNGNELTSNYICYCLRHNTAHPRQIVPVADFREWVASRKKPVYLILRQSDRYMLRSKALQGRGVVQPLSPDFLGVQLPAPQDR